MDMFAALFKCINQDEICEIEEDCKHSNKDKQMSIGRKKFNMDPKKGDVLYKIVV